MKCRYCSAEYQGDICPDCGTPAGMDRPPHQHSFSETMSETEPKKTVRNPAPPLQSTYFPPAAIQPQRSSCLRNILIVAGAMVAAVVVILCIGVFFYALEDNSYQYLDNGDYSISVSKELQEAVKEGPPEELEELRPEQYPDAMYEADSFRGSQLSSWAQILYDPQVTEDGCYFSFRTVSSENSEDVLFGVAFWEGNTTDLCDGRYIFLTGTIIGEYTYADSYGYEDYGPAIYAKELELSSYAEIFAPAMFTLSPDIPAVSRGGCTMKLERVEFAQIETRFYLTVDNQTDFDLVFYLDEITAYQDNRKYYWKENYDADNTILYNGIPPGNDQEVILTFPPMSDRWVIDLSIYVDSEVSQSPFRFQVPGETPPASSQTPSLTPSPAEPAIPAETPEASPLPEESLPTGEEGEALRRHIPVFSTFLFRGRML